MSGGWRLVIGLSMLCAFALIWCFTRTLFSIVYRSGTSSVVKDFCKISTHDRGLITGEGIANVILNYYVCNLGLDLSHPTYMVGQGYDSSMSGKCAGTQSRLFANSFQMPFMSTVRVMLWTWLSPNLVKCKQFVIFKGSLAKLRISSTVQRNELRFWRMQ